MAALELAMVSRAEVKAVAMGTVSVAWGGSSGQWKQTSDECLCRSPA